MPSIMHRSTVPAVIAALSLTATPVAAADSPAISAPTAVEIAPAWSPGDDTAHNHRYYRYRRHRGVDAGDVLAGVLIIGGIAAIAGAAKNSERRDRERDWRYPDPRRGDSRYDYNDARGIDRAVSMCVDAVERDARIETVDTVNRYAGGWQVAGSLYNGEGFTCSIGENGRIEAIDYGRGAQPYRGGYDDDDRDIGDEDRDYEYGAEADRQYDDDQYAAARARIDSQGDAQPAYPGGPIDDENDTNSADTDADIEYGTGYQGAGT